ncbi:MAG: hypothetical protein ACRDFW_09910 [bacterium]
MTSRTPNISRLAMRQIPRLERAVRRLDHPCQGGFIALLNAIDWQAEIGRGDPECIHHLGLAILAFARSLGIDPDSTGIAPAVAPLLQQLSGKSFTPVTSYDSHSLLITGVPATIPARVRAGCCASYE